MSFGFGISDFLTVGGLCWKLYKKCKDSPGNYKQLTSEVGRLHIVMEETEELLSQQSLSMQQEEKLRVVTAGCVEVLQDLGELLAKYGRRGTKSQRTLDRLGFGTEDIDAIRTRLILNVTLLDAFNNTSSNARLEEKLNILITEIRSGKREGSVISTRTVDSIARNDRIAWEMFRKELEDVGVSSSVIAEKRQFLIVWFQEAVAAGKLEEDIAEHEGKEDNDDPLDQSTSGHSRRANHKPYAFNSSRKHVSRHRQFDRSVPSTKQRFSLNRTGSDGSPINLGGLAIAESKKDCQMEPLPLQRQSATEDINYHPKREGMTPSGGFQQVTSGKVSNPYVHSNNPQPDKNLRQQKNKRSRLRSSKEDIFKAVRSGDPTRVDRALKQGGDVHSIEKGFDESPLHVATRKGKTEVVSLLLQHGHVVNFPDSRGYTPLHLAAWNGRVEIAKLLLQHEAELECVDYEIERTPLHMAAGEGHEGTIELLLDNEAEVNVKNHFEITPLHMAAWYGHEEIAKILLNKGAEVNAKDNHEQTSLHVAAKNGHQETIKILLGKGAGVNVKDWIQRTPLHLAAGEGHEGTIELLLDREADVNAKDVFERTPLHLAAGEGHEGTIRILLAEGADPDAKDYQEDTAGTALALAKLNGHHSIAMLLDVARRSA